MDTWTPDDSVEPDRTEVVSEPRTFKLRGQASDPISGALVDVELDISEEQYRKLFPDTGKYSIQERKVFVKRDPLEVKLPSTAIGANREPKWNFNEYSRLFEDGHWYLVGGPEGSVHHEDCPCVWTVRDSGEDRRPCKGRNSNVCVAEGCYGEACLEQEPEFWDVVGRRLEAEIRILIREELVRGSGVERPQTRTDPNE